MPVESRRHLDSGHKCHSEIDTSVARFIPPRSRVVVGKRYDVEPLVLRGNHQLGRRLHTVRIVRMEMQVDARVCHAFSLVFGRVTLGT